MSSNQNGPSPPKVTAFSEKLTVSTRHIRQIEGQNSSSPLRRSMTRSVALPNEQTMSLEEIYLLDDFGYDTSLKKNTRAPLDSLKIPKSKIKHLVSALEKEPHERTSKDIEDLRKILAEVPFFQQYMTKNEQHLNQYDLNDLGKLLTYQKIEAGEEVQLFGEKSNQMYIILKGKIALARPITHKKSVPLEHLNIGGTFQTQMKKQSTKRVGKQAKAQSQAVADPMKSQVMFNGIACRFLVTVDLVDENGNIQKVKRPHPIYTEVAEMQKVLQNLKTQHLETPAFRGKLDQTIQQKDQVTPSEQAFQAKLKHTITARHERENKYLDRQKSTTDQRRPSHDVHMTAHFQHIIRLKAEEDHIEQIIYHNKPTIVPSDERYVTSGTGHNYDHLNNIMVETVESLSQDLDDKRSSDVSVVFKEISDKDGRSIALAIANQDPHFDTESSISDGDLPIDYDEMECPTEEIFDCLRDGQYFGQLSLLENSQNKRASVYSKTKVHLLIVEKLAFQRMLVFHQKRHEAELLTFLKTIPLLKTFPNSQLKKLVCYFTPVKKIIHSYLYKENEPSSHVYIVKEGEFRVTRRVQKQSVNNEPHPKDVYDNPMKSMKGQSKYFVKNIQHHYETIELQTLGKSQLIGDEDCAMSERYNTTVQCISQEAKLIIITREDFRRIESQVVQWTSILNNGEQKIRRYHEKMRQFKFVQLHIQDEMVSASATAQSVKKGSKKFIAGEDLLKQYRDSVKNPNGDMIENPIFTGKHLEVNLEELITRRVPQQILSLKPPKAELRSSSISHQNLQEAFTTLLTNHNNIQGLNEGKHERKISTAVPHARNPRLQTQPLNAEPNKNTLSEMFDKYKTPNQGVRNQIAALTSASSKIPRNGKSFSTADALQSMNPRKLQTTAYLKLKENFKSRSIKQPVPLAKNTKYSMSWNLSPTYNQPPKRLPIDLNFQI